MTMPQWFLLTHQTMTDMPFVAPMAAAMALFLLGAHADPDDEVKVYEVDLGGVTLRLSAYHLVLGAIVVCALPQILYLVSRNLSRHSWLPHACGRFSSGSPGNCDLPGNEPCRTATPVLRGLQPALQAAIWAQALASKGLGNTSTAQSWSNWLSTLPGLTEGIRGTISDFKNLRAPATMASQIIGMACAASGNCWQRSTLT